MPHSQSREQIERFTSIPRIARWIAYMSFVLALLLSLVMTSLFVYTRLYHYVGTIAWSPPGLISVATHALISPTAAAGQDHQTVSPPGSWKVLPSLPSPQADNATVYVQAQGRGYVYMSGGYHGHKYSPHYDHNLYRYDVAAARWQIVASENFPGMVNNAIALDEQNRLFFIAGYSSDVYAITSLLYLYRPSDGVIQKIISPAQVSIGFGAAMLADRQGHLYITQGFVRPGDPQAHAGTGWYQYDIASGRWRILAPLPVGLGYIALASDDAGGIVLLGGAMDAGQRLPSMHIYRYDIMNNTWTQAQALSPLAFSGAASCVDGHGHIVIVGGSAGYHTVGTRFIASAGDPVWGTGNAPALLRQSWLVDLHTLHWQALAPLPSGGSLLGTAACDGQGHVFLVRGADDSGAPTTDFLLLTL